MTPESLCFTDAALKRKNKEISAQVFLESILAHCRRVRQGYNRKCNDDTTCLDYGKDIIHYGVKLREIDPITSQFRDWTLRLGAEPVSAFPLSKLSLGRSVNIPFL
jgi:hypothetical protein